MYKGLQEVLNDNNNILNGIYLNKILVNKVQNTWDVYLMSEGVVNDGCISLIKKNLSRKFGIKGNINILVQNNNKKKKEYKLEDLKNNDIFKDIINNIFKDNPMISCIIQSADVKVTQDGNIKIKIDNEFTKSFLSSKRIEDTIKYYLHENHNLSTKVVFESEKVDFEEYNQLKKDEDKDIIGNFIAETISAVKENKQATPQKSYGNSGDSQGDKKSEFLYGKKMSAPTIKINEVSEEYDNVCIIGTVFKVDIRETRSGKFIYKFFITDFTSSISVKMFLKPEQLDAIKEKVKEGAFLKVQGNIVNDTFDKEIVMMANCIKEEIFVQREDKSEEKRVELHLHTQMSSMDGLSSAASLVKRASDWGHKAVAITDHGVVQAFPEAMDAAKKYGIKVIYGVEAYLVDDGEPIIYATDDRSIEDEYVVFDIETTGFNSHSDDIIEIGAVKVKNLSIVDRFSAFVKPTKEIPYKITELTGITNEMVEGAEEVSYILNKFLDFIGTSPVVAHNAKFDVGFIKEKLKLIDMSFNNSAIDTLALSRWLLPDLKKHKLDVVTSHLGINLENHHRAVDDAEATALMFIKFMEMVKENGAEKLQDINRLYTGNFDIKKASTHHTIILVKDYKGLYNLYKLISMAHIDYYFKRPRIPKSVLQQYREGLIIGSACEAGQVYKGILNNLPSGDIENIVKFYDYLEIQPRGNNMFLINNGTLENESDLLNINKKIVDLALKNNKPVVATGDVHFLDPHDEYFRRILMAGQGFSDADNQAPLYFKTTDEMLDEFNYLGSDLAYDVVIKYPNLIAESIDELLPIPKGTFPPKIDGSDEEVREMTMTKAHEIYGESLPEVVEKRLEKELNSIINNGYAVLYLIAHKLVAKSISDGYLVGSRGSVGSSFVATMCEITEVNPLPPHYVCPNCKNSEFFLDGTIGSGADLPDKECPNCNTKYIKEGHDIPFEVFLGFEGDKEPDIDLNFSGEYQSVAHKYTEELFGTGYVFKAGTIGTIAEKTAYGFVKNYLDERGNHHVTNAEVERLIKGCTGVKRTTGQHPGGIMVVPNDREIYEFTPVQRPADDVNSDITTTHFDYHSISGRLLKLDILGHDDPTVIRMLQDLTGVNPQTIPLGDPKVLKLFTSTESLGVTPEDIDCEVGTLGLPEFGTKFVRQMLIETQPKTFAELCRISGLSHGTDVWINNAQEVIKNGYATLKDVISTRDDIMLYLIYKGVNPKHAFSIMENVRKGKGLKDADVEVMKENKVPQWYIESCQKIKYMFPKGHAVAYVMMAIRIAYFKVYYPKAYYATYFTVRADDFDAELACKGEGAVLSKMKEIQSMGNNLTQKDKGILTVLEIVYEMYKRGIKLLPVDLYKSDANKFKIVGDCILPPFSSLQGVGGIAARSIASASEDGEFLSKEDLRNRAKVSKSVIEVLTTHGCLQGLPETNQLSLF